MLYVSDLQGLGWLGYIPLLAFAVLGAFRLARFNIKTDEVHGYFEGSSYSSSRLFSGYLPFYVVCKSHN